MNRQRPAFLHHAELTLCAKNKMARVLVHASPNTLEIHTKDVDPNVFLIPIVHQIEHVLEINVKIHVLAHVVRMLIVRLLTICLLAHVAKVTLVIHTDIVQYPKMNVRRP